MAIFTLSILIRRVCLAVFCVGNIATVWAQQVDLYNHGTLIYIPNGAEVHIHGDYVDDSGVSDFGTSPKKKKPTDNTFPPLDAPVFLSGTLYIGGKIKNNNATTHTHLIFEFQESPLTGKVVLSGDEIGGSESSYFPNLEINTPSTVSLTNDINIDFNLTLTSGDIALNNRVIYLSQNGNILNEKSTSKIKGPLGRIEATVFQLSPPQNVNNYRGIGVGYLSNTANFVNTGLQRVYQPHSYPVADGVYVLREYTMQTTITTPDKFDALTFYYDDSELNGLAESELALYVSNDNGGTWLKVGNAVDANANTVTAANVWIKGGGAQNVFVVAVNNCVASRPDATISSVSPSPPIVSKYMNICDQKLIELTVPTGNNFYYSITPPVAHPMVSSNVFSVSAIDFSYEGSYQSFVRTPRGCEDTDAITVDVRAVPVADFSMSPDPAHASLCFGKPVDFTDQSTTSDGTVIDKWSWDFNDNPATTSSAQSPTHIYATTGPHTPQLVATSYYGCVSAVKSKPIIIDTLPVPDFDITDGTNPIAAICEDIDVHLKNKSGYVDYANTDRTGELTYSWDYGDGNFSSAANPLHPYATFDTYTITLTATAPTQCNSQITRQIIVNPEPVPQFIPKIQNVGVSEACAGEYILFENNSTMPGTTAMTYQWDFKDGTSSTEVNPLKEFVPADDYDVKLTATSVVFGCSESYVVPVKINPPPVGDFTIADPDICLTDVAVLTNNSSISSGTLSYQWDFGDTNSSSSSQPQLTHSYGQPMQYKVKLTRVSDKGCTNTVSRNLLVHPSPVASFTHINACDGQAVTFYNNSVIQSDAIQTYLWNFNDNTTSSAIKPVHTFPQHGSYNVTLTATSDFGCVGQVNKQVVIYQNPSFNLGASITGCSDPYLLNPANDVSGGLFLPAGSTYTWYDPANQVISNADKVLVNHSGVYKVTIQMPAPQSCVSTSSLPLFLFKPVYLGQDVTACSQVMLDAETGLTGEKARAQQTAYEWRKDGNLISTQQVLTVTSSGDYTVTVTRTVAGNSCSSSDDIHVDIELPLSFTLPATITKCDGQSLVLDAGVNAQSYRWTNLNSGEVAGTGPTLNVVASGTYKVEAKNTTCASTATTAVIFSPLPSVSFGASSTFGCTGQAITFTDYSFADVGNINATQWNFGDNSSASNQSTASKQYVSPGTYAVALTATTTNGCQATFTQDIIIKQSPTVAFTIPTACADEVVNLQNNSLPASASVVWNFDDGTQSTVFNPVKVYHKSGQFNVTLKATEQGCTSSQVQQVAIHSLPELDLGDQITTCGNSIVLDASNPGSSYRWFDTQNNTTLSNARQFQVNADRSVGVEVINVWGCRIIDEADVQLNTPLVVSLGTNREVCDSEILNAGYFPGAQFTWSTGATTQKAEVFTSGNYSVSVTDQNGCAGGASVVLQVKDTPVISLGGDRAICAGDQLQLNAGTNLSYSYSWSTGATSPVVMVNAAGLYSVSVAHGACIASQSATITVNALPFVSFSESGNCAGQSMAFVNHSQDAGDGALSYQWDFGDGTISTQASPAKKYSTSGTHQVTLKAVTPHQCVSQMAKQVKINAVPVATFSVGDGCTFTDLHFTNTTSYAGTGGLTYQWDFGNGDGYTGVQPTFAYRSPGKYVVNLIASSADGCADNYVQEVVIGNTPSLSNWVSDASTCNASLTLDAGNTGSTYLWSDNTRQQTLTTNKSGHYTVTILSPDGCPATAEVDVTFNKQVQPVLSSTMEGCGSVFIDPQVNAATYLWSTGAQSKTIKVLTSDVYSVQVISADLCIGRASTSVDVHPVPEVDLGSDRHACDGEVIVLNAASDLPVTYEWSTGAVVDHIDLTKTGRYAVKLVTDHSCTATDTVQVTFHQLPVLSLKDKITACGSIDLDAGNDGSKILWSTGSTERIVTFTTSGTYAVQVTNKDNCTSKKSMNLNLLPLPSLELGNDRVLCNGATTVLDAGTSAGRYRWSDNSTGRYLTTGASGQYSVTITDEAGCSATDKVKVIVRPPSGLDLGPDRFVCNTKGINLNAGINNVSYQWGSDTGLSSRQKQVNIDKPGKYWVKIMDEYTCADSDTIAVSLTTQTITASFLIPSVVDVGDVVHFAQLTDPKPLKFTWAFGDGVSSTEENPTHRYFKVGDFSPTLVVSNGVCTDTLTKVITIRNARTASDPKPVLARFVDFVDVKLFPNPTTGIFKIQLRLTTESEVLVTIYSLNGSVIDEKRKELAEDVMEFDLTTVSEGLYLLRIVADNKIKSLKLVKTGQ